MNRLARRFIDTLRKGDLVLLLLCVVANAFGCLMVASTTNGYSEGSLRYLIVQIGASLAGIAAYVGMASIDTDFFSEHRRALVVFNTVLLFLLIPFGVTVNGNRSWLNFPILPFNIQVAEICKITFILILASVMASHQNQLSSYKNIIHMLVHLGLLFGLSILLSDDLGVSLVFIVIFAGMAFSGGVNLLWFLAAALLLGTAAPIVWSVMPEYRRERIMVLFDPSLDPYGTGAMYHSIRAQRSLTGGGLTGQGLFQGNRTQAGALYAQHTDYIFAAIGEELGFLGCAFVLLLLALIIARCIWVGVRSQDLMRRLVCFGASAALIFQVVINVGMCIGVMPVIGLTLPFISYGGSSIITLYAMLGLVSGVYARPAPTSQERYIRPPLPKRIYR